MLHLLYILAFSVLAILAVGNLIRSLLTLGLESTRSYPAPSGFSGMGQNAYGNGSVLSRRPVPHPEFLDETGNVINEPLLIMRSITVEDAREQLDALYNSSPNTPTNDRREES
ncbi:MAG: DUF2973 domain-containing protein [Desertifilum sp. SIO1I2]|nr:DUF2973 domain-containing protein [Desertifilum sp. SIO1I2]